MDKRKLLIKNWVIKSIFLSIIIFSPILFGQIQSIPISKGLKERTEKNESYQISSLARSTAVEIILPPLTKSSTCLPTLIPLCKRCI